METENPASFQYMTRALGNSSSPVSLISSSSSSGSFSDCSSDRSGDFASSSAAAACSLARRILVSSAVAAASSSSSSSYTDDLIRGLVSDLESPGSSLDSQRRAAMELRLLAKHDPDNRLRIARAGAVRPLVALVSSPDPQLQEHGITALLNLSIRDENKDLIASAGAIRPLVRALKSGGTAAARENAACALLRLAQARGDGHDCSASQHRLAIGRSGAIPFLVDLLETGGIRGKKDAATALYMLCSSSSSRENKVRAVQAGVVRPLLELMSDPESGMVDKAAYVLAAVVIGVPDARAKVVDEGGVPVLVEMLETGTQRHKEIAADVLLYVCEESEAYRGMVSWEGAIPPLVALSQSGSSRGKKKAETLIELLRQPRTAAGGSRE